MARRSQCSLSQASGRPFSKAWVDRRGDQDQAAEIGDLVAPERHQPGHDAEAERQKMGAPREALLERQQRQRQEGVAEDHPRMLQARGGRAAHHEHHRGDERRRRAEAAPEAEEADRYAADQEMRIDRDVESEHRRVGREIGEERHGRREQQRLRIRDRRVAGEMIGIPAREHAVGERRSEIAEHRIEMILGVPRHDLAAQRPGERGGEPHREDRCGGDTAHAQTRTHDPAGALGRNEARRIGHGVEISRKLSN